MILLLKRKDLRQSFKIYQTRFIFRPKILKRYLTDFKTLYEIVDKIKKNHCNHSIVRFQCIKMLYTKTNRWKRSFFSFSRWYLRELLNTKRKYMYLPVRSSDVIVCHIKLLNIDFLAWTTTTTTKKTTK